MANAPKNIPVNPPITNKNIKLKKYKNGVLNEIPIGDSPLEISYVELNGSKYNEVDYIFGDLQIF